jgi:hypothetical protein
MMLRSTENEIAFAILGFLANVRTGEASIFQIKKHLRHSYNFTQDDIQQSVTRIHEQLWEQQVRNIKSHSAAFGNYINSGYLAYRPRHLAITDLGRTHLAAGVP